MGAIGWQSEARPFISIGGQRHYMGHFTGKKILITGINGFIGSHLAHALVEEHAIVEGTSRNPAETPRLTQLLRDQKIPIHRLEFREKRNFISSLLEKGEYDTIFHLASQSDTWNSTQKPLETFETNVNGTLQLLETLRQIRSNTPIVIAGSVRAFEPLNSSKVDVMAPLHPYDASKFCMQIMALSYFNAYSIPGAIAQNTNVFGPNDTNYNRLIPKIMKTLFNDEKIVLKGNGQIKRDFLYVKDAVRGMLSAAENLSHPHARGKSFTFASGKRSSIREIAETIKKLLPKKADISFDNQPFEDRDHPQIDISPTTSLLGWKPLYSLEQGLKETIEWYDAYYHLQSKMEGIK